MFCYGVEIKDYIFYMVMRARVLKAMMYMDARLIAEKCIMAVIFPFRNLSDIRSLADYHTNQNSDIRGFAFFRVPSCTESYPQKNLF